MNKKEKNEFSKAIENFKNEILSSKENSQKFLIELGIFTKSGNLKKPYRNLKKCIRPCGGIGIHDA